MPDFLNIKAKGTIINATCKPDTDKICDNPEALKAVSISLEYLYVTCQHTIEDRLVQVKAVINYLYAFPQKPAFRNDILLTSLNYVIFLHVHCCRYPANSKITSVIKASWISHTCRNIKHLLLLFYPIIKSLTLSKPYLFALGFNNINLMLL